MVHEAVPFILAVFVVGSCASSSSLDPRPTVVFMPPGNQPASRTLSTSAGRQFNVPATVVDWLTGEPVTLNIPREMRGIAIEYVEAAGGLVVEPSDASRTASWMLYARTRTERAFVGVVREKVVVEVELRQRGLKHGWQVASRARGEEFFHGHEWAAAVAAAGRQALEQLERETPGSDQ